MNNNEHDLTTKKGMQESLNYLKVWAEVMFPLQTAVIKGIRSLMDTSAKTTEQARLAGELIKKGKEEGVDSMKIKLSNEAGIKLKSSMPDYPIEAKIGSDGVMELEVRYK